MFVVSPILNRELLTFLRKPRAFIGLLLFLLILAVVFVVNWSRVGEVITATDRDVLARRLFHLVAGAMIVVCSLYAFLITSTKINAERDAKTLDLLLAAPLSGLHILLAKYVSALAFILLLVAASLPFLMICFLLGGLAASDVTQSFAIALAAVLACGMIGLACSALCRRHHVALLAGFMMLALLAGGGALLSVPILEMLDVGSSDWINGVVMTVFEATSPLGAFQHVWDPRGMLPPGFLGFTAPILVHLAFQAAVVAIGLLIAARAFRREALGPADTARPRRQRRALASAPAEPQRAGPLPPARRARRLRLPWRRPWRIPDGANPVFVREDRLFFGRRPRTAILGLAAGALALALISWIIRENSGNAYTFDNQMCVLAVMMLALLALFAPGFAARTITSERETHCLPLLLATPLRPVEILWGKFAAVMKQAVRAVALLSFLAVVLLPCPSAMLPAILVDWAKILLPLAAIAAVFVALGVLVSVHCRRSVTAIVMTYAILLVLLVGVPVLIFMFRSHLLSHPTAPGRGIEPIVLPVLMPYVFFLSDAAAVNAFHNNQRWADIFCYSLLMSAVAAALLGWAALRFSDLGVADRVEESIAKRLVFRASDART